MRYYRIRLQNGLTAILLLSCFSLNAQKADKIGPVFKDGEAQVVPAFENAQNWIRHDLWVEAEFDTDGDGKLDRMHVSVTRPGETDTDSLKLPVIYVTSPYFAGVAPNVDGLFWDVKLELGQRAKPRTHVEVERRGVRPIISNSHLKEWIPRGYIVVHSSSPGTGLVSYPTNRCIEKCNKSPKLWKDEEVKIY